MTQPQLIDRVIDGGYCVGCGACAVAAPDEFAVDLDEAGRFCARRLKPAEARRTDPSDICPMSGAGADEDQIAEARFPDLPVHPQIGRHARCGVGWVAAGGYRERGSSGGMLSWLAARLLEEGRVKGVIHVEPVEPDGRRTLFRFTISRSVEEVTRRAKSRYAPVSLATILDHALAGEGPYALVALPCFIKAFDLLQRKDGRFDDMVAFRLGLVCGHLKSAAFGELLAWQKGVVPDALTAIDFRDKIPDRPASSYGFRASGAGRSVAAPMAEMAGKDWGEGLFKYKACDFCDDVLAECADVAVGDAWLPGWRDDWRGTNVVVARHPIIVELIDRGRASGVLVWHDVAPDIAAQSQASGLRHRREGLSWRLARAQAAGEWAPRKRVGPSGAIPERRGRTYAMRERLRDLSHAAFAEARAAGDLGRFVALMEPVLAEYRHLQRPTWREAAVANTRRFIKAWLPASVLAKAKRIVRSRRA